MKTLTQMMTAPASILKKTCPTCLGNKQVVPMLHKCKDCNGTGYITRPNTANEVAKWIADLI